MKHLLTFLRRILRVEITIVQKAAAQPPQDFGLCSAEPSDYMQPGDVLEFLREMNIADRKLLLDEIRASHCFKCGAHEVIRIGPCSCRQWRSSRKGVAA